MKVRAWTVMVATALACLGAGCAAEDAEPSGSTSSAQTTQLGNVMDMADAQQTIAQLSDQLDAELGQVGPGLTHDQQSAYLAQFASDSAPTIKAAQDKYDAAADRISAYLKQRVPEVIAFATNQAPASADGEELYSAYLVLAQTKHADESMRFMNSLAHDAAFAKLMAISDSFYDADRPRPADVVAIAVPHLVAKQLADHQTPDQVIAALENVLGKSLSGSAITTYKGGFALIDLVRASRTKGKDHLDALMPVAEIDKIGDKAIAKAVIGAGAALSLWSAKDSLAQGDFTGFLTSTAGAASDTLVIVGELAESVHAFKPFAETLVDVGER
ncbi:MAG TPA: hypothetical protein VIF62_27695, partial [Labilithrix sp.]